MWAATDPLSHFPSTPLKTKDVVALVFFFLSPKFLMLSLLYMSMACVRWVGEWGRGLGIADRHCVCIWKEENNSAEILLSCHLYPGSRDTTYIYRPWGTCYPAPWPALSYLVHRQGFTDGHHSIWQVSAQPQDGVCSFFFFVCLFSFKTQFIFYPTSMPAGPLDSNGIWARFPCDSIMIFTHCRNSCLLLQ